MEQMLSALSGNSESFSATEAFQVLRASTDSLYDARITSALSDADNAKIRLKIAKEKMKLANATLANTSRISSGSTVSSAERESRAQTSLELATNSLANTTELMKTEEDGLYRSSLSSLTNAFIIARTAREFTDSFLGVTDVNRSRNDAFEQLLDTSAKNQAENAFLDFNKKYETTYDWYYANIAGKSEVGSGTVQE